MQNGAHDIINTNLTDIASLQLAHNNLSHKLW